jgi:hypothetical protein
VAVDPPTLTTACGGQPACTGHDWGGLEVDGEDDYGTYKS